MEARRINVMRCFALCFALTITLLFLISCGKGGKVRKYKEKERTPASRPMPMPGAEIDHTHFQWQTPAGWSEDKTAGGFRLAAFIIKSATDKSTALCTIIPLQGEAGGLRANIERWLAQISGDTVLPSDTVERLLKAQEKFLTAGQFPAVMIDFTVLTTKPTDKSILAAVITVNGNSIFIKMTGEKFLLSENKVKLKTLCQSFTLKN